MAIQMTQSVSGTCLPIKSLQYWLFFPASWDKTEWDLQLLVLSQCIIYQHMKSRDHLANDCTNISGNTKTIPEIIFDFLSRQDLAIHLASNVETNKGKGRVFILNGKSHSRYLLTFDRHLIIKKSPALLREGPVIKSICCCSN